MGKPAAKKSKPPVDKPTDKFKRASTKPAVSSRPTAVVPEEMYHTPSDLRTLTEAEEIKRNAKRMQAVKEHAAKQIEATNRALAMKPHKNDKTVK